MFFVTALAIGTAYTRAFERIGAPPEPWVRELSAAIAFACGHGYVDPGYAPSRDVESFLAKRVDAITCDGLPAAQAEAPPNFTQGLYRYMTLAAGIVWRIAGISWTRLSLLFGCLYAVSAVAIYGLFRLAAGRVLAAAGTVALVISPLQLRYLPQLRDYAKAPFILLLILILGALIVRPYTRPRLLWLSAAYGAVMGIGFGFRNDLLINAVPFVAVIAVALPVALRSEMRIRAAALAVFAVVFIVFAWPIIRAYRSGSNTGHVAVLGLMTHFDEPLGVTESVYDWGQPYDDGFAIKTITSFAQRVEGRHVTALSREYDGAALHYLLTIARHWPADLLTRALASASRVVDLPFQIRNYTTAAPPAVGGSVLTSLYGAWDAVLSRLSGVGPGLVLVAIAGVAAVSLRIAACCFLGVLYFGGYPALQFDARHFFFLEFIPWLAAALVVRCTLEAVSTLRKPGAIDSATRARFVRAGAFFIAVIAVVWGTTATARAYQQIHVSRMLESYLAAPTEMLTIEPRQRDDGFVVLQPRGLSRVTEPSVRAEYLVVDVTPKACGRLIVPITFRYETMEGYTDLSQRVYVPRSDRMEPYHLFFPVYYSAGGYFDGVEVMDADALCVTAIRRVTDLTRTPVLLDLDLPANWSEMPLYQTVTRWEAPIAPYRVSVHAWPRLLDPAPLELQPAPLPRLASMPRSRIVAAEADAWNARGFVRDPTGMLFEVAEHAVHKGDCFFLRGSLRRGGLTLGVLDRGRWATTVNVTTPGEFLAVVRAPADGTYAPAVASFLAGMNRRNEFVVAAAGWATPHNR